VKLQKDTVWLNLNQMSILFDRDKSVVSRHIQNVYKEGELEDTATVAKFATVQDEGGRTIERNLEYYNLDVIISVGYRIKSQRGTQFRIWATQVLKDHLESGFTDKTIAGIKRNQRRGLHDKTNRALWHRGNSLPHCESTRTGSYSGC
jgi:hypothetical protein